ncbi:hypothetical protein CSAL01_11412 [Colletotrichum salicis]|uniref:SH3 domain-containing protein n=1 Tax=Colletotrichum salicis TaxID=1209931 RepID=A0A135TBU5_9PEZI|nr:hypothetical protein CSAL01_11412 [Colletotrichum salicis]
MYGTSATSTSTTTFGRRINIIDIDLRLNPSSSFPENDILAQFPIATALKSHVQRKGENLLGPDGSSNVLTFFIGAKIVGIEFPEQWGGKWCTGWHDGVQGPFPAKCVEIESPKQNEISFQATSAVSITTRWKWDPPDNSRAGWLTFGKGEVIRNVGFSEGGFFTTDREAATTQWPHEVV